MKHTIKFNIPEDADLLEDYRLGLKYKWFLDDWLQGIKWEVEDGRITHASDLLDRLKSDLHEAIQS